MIYDKPVKLASVVATKSESDVKSGYVNMGASISFVFKMSIAVMASTPSLIGTYFLSSECPLTRSDSGDIICAKCSMNLAY